jgi:murein DD-endopeptidase MepM/ murein hydrolase activator NlpD
MTTAKHTAAYLLQSLCLLALPMIAAAQEPLATDSAEVEISLDDDVMEADSLAADTSLAAFAYPAFEVYGKSWSNIMVNPYDSSLLNKPDTTLIDLRGYAHPNHNVITSGFGFRKWRYHYGTDTRLHVGDSIRCAFDGRVRIAMRGKAYGNFVVVRHYNGLETTYAHLKKSLVRVNDVLKSGDVLGLGGSTGRSTGPHLHFELRYLGSPIDPTSVIDFELGKPRCDTLCVCAATYEYIHEINKIRVWIVRPGDTLSKISQRTGISIARLCQLNNISRRTILRLGRRIRYT